MIEKTEMSEMTQVRDALEEILSDRSVLFLLSFYLFKEITSIIFEILKGDPKKCTNL